MRRIEFILVSLFMVGFIGKCLLIPYSNLIVGLALNFLALFYFVLSIPLFFNIPIKKIFKKDSYKGISAIRIIGIIGIGYLFPIIITGMMFKFLMLNGAGFMLGIGIIGLIIIGSITLVKLFTSSNKGFYRFVLIRVFLVVTVGLIVYNIPTNKQVAFFYRDYPDFVKLYDEYSKDRKNKELEEKVFEYREKINR